MSEEKTYSVNEFAEQIVGKRPPVRGIILFQPCEEGYHCPVCKYENVTDGEFDQRLEWSEYNGFVWCRVCDKDYPSAICKMDVDDAITTYLLTVWAARKNMSYDRHEIERKIGKFVEEGKTAEADELSKGLLILEKYYKLNYEEEGQG
jgi:hypothetical protein